MTWSHHIQAIVNKATKMLNFVKRTLYQCDPEVKATTYSTLVRPTLEYTTVVRDPHQQYLINSIETASYIEITLNGTYCLDIGSLADSPCFSSFYTKTHALHIDSLHTAHSSSTLRPTIHIYNILLKSFFPRTISY